MCAGAVPTHMLARTEGHSLHQRTCHVWECVCMSASLCVSVCECVNVGWILICPFFHPCFHSFIRRPCSYSPEQYSCARVCRAEPPCLCMWACQGVNYNAPCPWPHAHAYPSGSGPASQGGEWSVWGPLFAYSLGPRCLSLVGWATTSERHQGVGLCVEMRLWQEGRGLPCWGPEGRLGQVRARPQEARLAR